MLRRRQQLVKMQVAERNPHTRASQTVQTDLKAHIEQQQRKDETLQSVKGIGQVTSNQRRHLVLPIASHQVFSLTFDFQDNRYAEVD